MSTLCYNVLVDGKSTRNEREVLKNLNLREKRIKQNLTQKDLAKKIGVDVTHISHIENGSRTPSVPLAKKIAEVLSCDWTAFFTDES